MVRREEGGKPPMGIHRGLLSVGVSARVRAMGEYPGALPHRHPKIRNRDIGMGNTVGRVCLDKEEIGWRYHDNKHVLWGRVLTYVGRKSRSELESHRDELAFESSRAEIAFVLMMGSG